MNIGQYYPCKKLIEWLLLEHRKSVWKVNQKITYKKFLPHSKQFINNWINENLFGPTKLMLINIMKSISTPKTLESRYKKFHSDIWKILEDHTIREQIELDSLFGFSTKDVWERLNNKIKPRVVDALAIKQFRYFFWNLDDDGVFRPTRALKLIESNRELTRVYSHILKYSKDKNGLIRYEHFYHLNNPEEPDLTNVNKVINLTAIEQIDSYEKGNYDKIEVLTDILLKNAEVFKILKTLSNSSGKQDLSDIINLKD